MDTGEYVTNGTKPQPNEEVPANLFHRVYIWDGKKFILEMNISNKLKEFVEPQNVPPNI